MSDSLFEATAVAVRKLAEATADPNADLSYVKKKVAHEIEVLRENLLEPVAPGPLSTMLSSTMDRFQGTPEPIPWLVEKIIPAGQVGCLHGPGGTHKSSLALDLAIRVALAPIYDNVYFMEQPVRSDKPCSVLILGCEDDESIIHIRYVGGLEVIADELSDFENLRGGERYTAAGLRKAIDGNIYFHNLVGKNAQLFSMADLRSLELKTTSNFNDLYKGLQELRDRSLKGSCSPCRLVIIDTRAKMSPAEEGGVTIATKEVSFLEGLAKEFELTILLISHDNKASYGQSSFGSGGQKAIRGSSAFMDSLRFALHLSIPPKGLEALNIDECIQLSHSKLNCGPKMFPKLLRREGCRFRIIEATYTSSGTALRNEQLLEELKKEKSRWPASELRSEVMARGGMSGKGVGRTSATNIIGDWVDRGKLSKDETQKRNPVYTFPVESFSLTD
jgi:hypothetical protein